MKKIICIFLFIGSSFLFSRDCFIKLNELDINGLPVSISIQGNYAYIAADLGGIRVIDISNPSNLLEVGHIDEFFTIEPVPGAHIYGIAVDGNRAYASYLGAYMRIIYTGIIVLDISDPVNPKEIGSYNTMADDWEFFYKLQAKGNIVFATKANGGFYILDATDPKNVYIKSFLNLNGFANNLMIENELAYVSVYPWYSGDNARKGIAIIDISNFSYAKEVVFIQTNSSPMDLKIMENILYIAERDLDGTSGLRIIDLSTLEMPKEIIFYEILGYSIISVIPTKNEVFVSAGIGAGEDRKGFLYKINFSNICKPIIVSSFYNGSYCLWNGILIKENLFYLDGINLVSFDISQCLEKYNFYIPAAANASGAYGTNWKTDLVLNNQNIYSVQANLFFLESGKDNRNANPVNITIQAKESLKILDVVKNVFGRENAFGAIKIESNSEIIVTSRTYTSSNGEGSYGQFIEAILENNSISAVETAILIQLEENSNFRANVGILNIIGQDITIKMELYKENGEYLGNIVNILMPYEHIQINNIFREVTNEDVDNGYIKIYTTTPKGKFISYASVVDNRTGDAICFISKTIN